MNLRSTSAQTENMFRKFLRNNRGGQNRENPLLDFKIQKNDVTFKSLSAENGISLAQNK